MKYKLNNIYNEDCLEAMKLKNQNKKVYFKEKE